jgi:hypothetical protein
VEAHLLRISRGRRHRASGALLLAAWAGGCGGGAPGVEAPVPGPSPRTYSADRVFTVEVWGAPAPDTLVTFPTARARSIVLRHGPPDNTVFAEVDIPPNALVAPGGRDSVTVSIRPVPGLYGVTLQSDAALSSPLVLTFKYPVHFAAPTDSRARYATDVLFEQALVVARAESDGARFLTLRSARPASDNLQAMIPSLGRYQLVAPR